MNAGGAMTADPAAAAIPRPIIRRNVQYVTGIVGT